MANLDIQARLAACRAEIEKLKQSIEGTKARLQDGSFGDVNWAKKPLGPAPRRRRVLQGHFNKVYALDWAHDSERLVSASQDGKLIVWNGRTRHKVAVISLKSTWVMTCAFEQSQGRFVASGGLDNVCTVHDLASPAGAGVELQGHDGYLSCARFLGGPDKILTASGDSTCMLWDVHRGCDVGHFTDHSGDVMSLSVMPGSGPAGGSGGSVFVSGSCDTSAKVWDIRTGRCVQTFVGHEGDINAVAFAPGGLGFATGSDDSTVKLFDLRSYSRLNDLSAESLVCGITSVGFSASGRVAWAGYDDCAAYGWDVTATAPAGQGSPVYQLQGHTGRVSSLAVNGAGTAVATGSWDTEVAIWA